MANKMTYGEKCWVKAFTEMNSSKFNQMQGATDIDKIMRLSDYLQSSKSTKQFENIAKGTEDFRNLDNIYVVFVTPTAGEFKGRQEVGLVVNIGHSKQLEDKSGAQYIDLGILDGDADSKESEFILDSKISQEQKEALKGAVDPETEENEFGVKTIEDLAEKLDKGKNLLPKSNKEIVERTGEVNGEVDEEKLEEKTDEEIEAERKGEELIPDAQKDVVEALLEAKGISKGDLKQVSIVPNPSELAQMSDEDNITENGGPVIVLTLKNKEANLNNQTDRMIAIQSNRVTDMRGMDRKIRDFLVRHGEDNSVINSVEEQYVKFNDLNGQPQTERLIGVEQKDVDFIEQKYNELVLRKNQAIKEIEEKDISDVEKAQEITEITGQFRAEVTKLQNESGISLPEIDGNALDEANKAASIEQKERAEEFGEKALDVTAGVALGLLGLDDEDDGIDPRDTRNGGSRYF